MVKRLEYKDGSELEQILGKANIGKYGTEKIERIPEKFHWLTILQCTQVKPILEDAKRYLDELQKKQPNVVYRPNYEAIRNKLIELGYYPWEVDELVRDLRDIIDDYYSPNTSPKAKKWITDVVLFAYVLETVDPNRKDYQVLVEKAMSLKNAERKTLYERL